MLVHIGFLSGLGMQLDLVRNRCHWGHLHRDSTLHSTPSGHLLIDMFDFTDWIPPPDEIRHMQKRHGEVVVFANSHSVRAQTQWSGSIKDAGPSSFPAYPKGKASVKEGEARTYKNRESAGVPMARATSSSLPSSQALLGAAADPDSAAIIDGERGSSRMSSPGEPDKCFKQCCDSAVSSDGATADGKRVGQESGQLSDCRGAVCTSRCSSKTARQCQGKVVDMYSLRPALGESRVHRAGASLQRDSAGGPVSQHSLPSDTSGISRLGSGRSRCGWRWHASAVAALCCLGCAAGAEHGLDGSSRGAVWPRGRAGADSGALDTSSSFLADLEKKPPGHVMKTTSRVLDQVLIELQGTSFPYQKRLGSKMSSQDPPAERGLLFGLYTRQGGCGLTRDSCHTGASSTGSAAASDCGGKKDCLH